MFRVFKILNLILWVPVSNGSAIVASYPFFHIYEANYLLEKRSTVTNFAHHYILPPCVANTQLFVEHLWYRYTSHNNDNVYIKATVECTNSQYKYTPWINSPYVMRRKNPPKWPFLKRCIYYGVSYECLSYNMPEGLFRSLQFVLAYAEQFFVNKRMACFPDFWGKKKMFSNAPLEFVELSLSGVLCRGKLAWFSMNMLISVHCEKKNIRIVCISAVSCKKQNVCNAITTNFKKF